MSAPNHVRIAIAMQGKHSYDYEEKLRCLLQPRAESEGSLFISAMIASITVT